MEYQGQPPPPQQTQTTEWRGPEIYLHLEFRVAWSKKQQQQPSKSHQVTYRSRSSRERAPAFPRQVPAPNTNYLAAIRDFDQRQAHVRELRQSYLHSQPQRGHSQLQEYYQRDEPRGRQQEVPIIREPQPPHRESRSRADSRSSYERGRSAPPPFGENPWDVNVAQRKALPAVPSQFRLGEGVEPWSTWSLPPGFGTDMFSSEEVDELTTLPRRDTQRDSITYATNPAMVSTFSPEPATRQQDQQRPATPPPTTDPVSTGKERELGALAAAMVTVDNGFENQWWYQGQRKRVVAEDGDQNEGLMTPTITTPIESPVLSSASNSYLRWPSVPTGDFPRADVDEEGEEEGASSSAVPTGIVSPMTEAALSPAPVFASLHRNSTPPSEPMDIRSTWSHQLWKIWQPGSLRSNTCLLDIWTVGRGLWAALNFLGSATSIYLRKEYTQMKREVPTTPHQSTKQSDE
ncbi:hypothetical protein QBC44DRAFT_312730 [Cladorrhinum sp. PSN332]|nr:hypothetical protein QBC44DRAFT_312730 [Cladorrhinum sp. PSN332]